MTVAMNSKYNRGIKVLMICVTATIATCSWAAGYSAQGATTDNVLQLRTGAQLSKKWHNGLKLSFSEELRFDLYDHLTGENAKGEIFDTTSAAFSKSYTTLTLGYTPIEYVKFDLGYTLRILGRKNSSNANEFIRHRAFVSVTGSYRFPLAKIYLRERFLCDIRTDSVNLEEKNRFNWLMRSRIGADFTIPGKPVKPYIWGELENTLNVPVYQQRNGQQFISHVRAQIGVKWRLSMLSSLDFYYRFQYGYNRNVNINNGYYEGKSLKLRLDEETTFLHAIGVVYNVDW